MFIASWGPYWVSRGSATYSFDGLMIDYTFGYNTNGSNLNTYYGNNLIGLDITTNSPSSINTIGEIYSVDDYSRWYNAGYYGPAFAYTSPIPIYSWSDDMIYFQGVEVFSSTAIPKVVVWDPRTRSKQETFELVDPQAEQYDKITSVTETYLWAKSSFNGNDAAILKRYDKTSRAYVDTVNGQSIVPEGVGTWLLAPVTDTLVLWYGYVTGVLNVHALKYTTAWTLAHTFVLPNTTFPDGNEQWMYSVMPIGYSYDPVNNELWLPMLRTGVNGDPYAIALNFNTGATTTLNSPGNESWESYTINFDRRTGKKFIETEFINNSENGCVEVGVDNVLIGIHGRELASDFRNYRWERFRPIGDYLAASSSENESPGLFKIGEPGKMPVGLPFANVVANNWISYFFPSSFYDYLLVPARTERPIQKTPVFRTTTPPVLAAFELDQPFQFLGPYSTSSSFPTEPILWFEINYTGRYPYQISIENFVLPTGQIYGYIYNQFGYAIYDVDGNLRVGGDPANILSINSQGTYTILTPLITPPGKYYLAVYPNKTAVGTTQLIWPQERGFMSTAITQKNAVSFYLFVRAC